MHINDKDYVQVLTASFCQSDGLAGAAIHGSQQLQRAYKQPASTIIGVVSLSRH